MRLRFRLGHIHWNSPPYDLSFSIGQRYKTLVEPFSCNFIANGIETGCNSRLHRNETIVGRARIDRQKHGSSTDRIIDCPTIGQFEQSHLLLSLTGFVRYEIGNSAGQLLQRHDFRL